MHRRRWPGPMRCRGRDLPRVRWSTRRWPGASRASRTGSAPGCHRGWARRGSATGTRPRGLPPSGSTGRRGWRLRGRPRRGGRGCGRGIRWPCRWADRSRRRRSRGGCAGPRGRVRGTQAVGGRCRDPRRWGRYRPGHGGRRRSLRRWSLPDPPGGARRRGCSRGRVPVRAGPGCRRLPRVRVRRPPRGGR